MTETKETWIEITLSTPPELTDALSNFIVELQSQGVSQESLPQESFDESESPGERDVVKAYFSPGPSAEKSIAALETYIESLSQLFPALERPAFTTKTIVDPDWGEQWKKFFKPLKVSRNIVIKPTWERYAPAGRDIVIDIDPGMAFGTGQHPSTRMCIVAIEEILLKDREHEKWSVLDVGTGTGILAICAAKLGAGRVVALDIDQKAIEIATENVILNGVRDRVEIVNRDVSRHRGSFNLIVANLTAATLSKLHKSLLRMTEPGGYFIASGIIDQDKPHIEKIFHAEDVDIHDVRSEQEWVCYVFRKRSAAP